MSEIMAKKADNVGGEIWIRLFFQSGVWNATDGDTLTTGPTREEALRMFGTIETAFPQKRNDVA